MKPVVAFLAVGLAVGSTSGVSGTQQGLAVLRVVEPVADTLLIGEGAFKAELLPEDVAVTSVDFFVDNVPACRATTRPFECSAAVGEKLFSRTVRVVANLADGSRVVSTIRTSGGLSEAVDVGAVLVPVVVSDRRGQFVQNLKQESFRVLEDGVPQTITSFQSENVPSDIVLAVDISSSMDPFMSKLKASVTRFLDELEALKGRNTRITVTVLAFNDRTFLVARPEADASERRSAVNALRAGGGTSLYDAILRSIEQMPAGISRKAVVVFTDGDDRSSLASMEPVARRVRDSDTTLYVITQGRDSQVEAVRRAVDRLAEMSGGRPFATGKIDELQPALEEILNDLTHQYLIGYAPTHTARDGVYHKIVVKTNVGSHEVRARDGYRAAGR